MIKKIIVMGVSGCGKSSMGQKIASYYGYPFFDGDDYHSEANVEKMRQGIPLTDEDRFGWLETLNGILKENDSAVVACSSLKPSYRDILRQGIDDLAIIYLQGDFDTIWQRHQKRAGHYFNGKGMLESQFATLVEPVDEPDVIAVDIRHSLEDVFAQSVAALEAR
ncbi:Thermoresistant gluconokinase [Marinomonas aquimarina]|uniref:Gluconokinase n=1 Tax=Marinomonas aquimarina TaxID=295068 RepID=A0A1A8TPE4_9GAMM|nr:gluconokinase [Marinomonas aquimarina]SBS35183.1 Thermoresistant gluconokinase [Marinomonas aquimarina]